jgi:polyisoprenoid-binding protein YceI
MTMKKLITCLIAALVAGAISAQSTWTIDKEHSSINFGVSHFQISQTVGRFRDFDAKVIAQSDDFSGAIVTFTAKTGSVCTDNEQRDHHLKSDAFLNTEKYPELTFSGILVKEGGKYLLKGNMTIRDITKPVTFAVAYTGRLKDTTFHFDKTGFVVTGSLNRSEYGLKWNETFQGGAPIVGDEVTLHLNIELNRHD